MRLICGMTPILMSNTILIFNIHLHPRFRLPIPDIDWSHTIDT